MEEDIHKLQKRLKDRLNELKNLYIENECYNEFVRSKKLDDDYIKYRDGFYKLRRWKG